jgi:hypothetical protein
MDISGNYTAVVAAIMNMSGTLGAFVCPIVLGYLFSYIEQSAADWNLVLYANQVSEKSGCAPDHDTEPRESDTGSLGQQW